MVQPYFVTFYEKALDHKNLPGENTLAYFTGVNSEDKPYNINIWSPNYKTFMATTMCRNKLERLSLTATTTLVFYLQTRLDPSH